MTLETAKAKLAAMINESGDLVQDQKNLHQYYSRQPNASGDILDRLAAEEMATLEACIKRGGDQ